MRDDHAEVERRYSESVVNVEKALNAKWNNIDSNCNISFSITPDNISSFYLSLLKIQTNITRISSLIAAVELGDRINPDSFDEIRSENQISTTLLNECFEAIVKSTEAIK